MFNLSFPNPPSLGPPIQKHKERGSNWPGVTRDLPPHPPSPAQLGWWAVLRGVSVMLRAGSPPEAPPLHFMFGGVLEAFVMFPCIAHIRHRNAPIPLPPAGLLSEFTFWKVVRASSCLPAFPCIPRLQPAITRAPLPPASGAELLHEQVPLHLDTLSGSP